MSTKNTKPIGIAAAILGALGLIRGIFVLVVSILGMVRLSGMPFTRARLFFTLSIAEGVLLGMVFGTILFVGGILLIRGRKGGQYTAWTYAGGRLLLGLLSLAAVIVFFVGGLRELRGVDILLLLAEEPARMALLGWLAWSMILLGMLFGFFMAVALFFLARTESGDAYSGGDSRSYYPPPTTTPVYTQDKTQLFRSGSKTISLQLLQNGKLKETKQFVLFSETGEARQFVVGRSSDCDMAINNDKSVSTRHCSFRCDSSGQVCLTDLDSSNGTLVKRGIAEPRKVKARLPILHDDIILLGYRGTSQIRVIYDTALKGHIDF
jgi:hypothetical protein